MQPTLPDEDVAEPALRLGPFLVDSLGRLSPAADEPPCFTLSWRDRSVRAELRHTAGEGVEGALKLGVLVGKVPSSVDAARPGGTPSPDRRGNMFTTLRALPPLLPDPWRVMLLPDHHICVAAEETIALPVSAVGLLTGLSMFLLTLAPYLDLLEALGSGPPARALTPPG